MRSNPIILSSQSQSQSQGPSRSRRARAPGVARAVSRALAGALTLACAIGAASAPDRAHAAEGIRIEVEFFQNAAPEPSNRALVFISERRLRIEQQSAGASQDVPVFLYRGDRNLLYSIVDGERTYLKIEPRLLMAMGGRRTARRELASTMDPIPEDQRRFFGHLLGTSQIDASRSEDVLVVRRTGGVGNFAGYACREVELGYVDRLLAQGCVADWQDVGLAPEDVEVFRSLASLVSSAAGRAGALPIEMVPGQPLDLVVQLGGFPLFFERAGRSSEASAIRVASVERMEVADADFDVPAGYAARSGVAGVFSFASLLSSRRAATDRGAAASASAIDSATTAMPASLAPEAGDFGAPPRRKSARRAHTAEASATRIADYGSVRVPDYLRYRPIRLFDDPE